mmetsp:Transcript_56061/g.133032  ORF Transcript_56061/g.133032 Transcript_56061/m.133032 type:complete len:242 (-) Transcript_56061:493-1218(-)
MTSQVDVRRKRCKRLCRNFSCPAAVAPLEISETTGLKGFLIHCHTRARKYPAETVTAHWGERSGILKSCPLLNIPSAARTMACGARILANIARITSSPMRTVGAKILGSEVQISPDPPGDGLVPRVTRCIAVSLAIEPPMFCFARRSAAASKSLYVVHELFCSGVRLGWWRAAERICERIVSPSDANHPIASIASTLRMRSGSAAASACEVHPPSECPRTEQFSHSSASITRTASVTASDA